jgi:hypothetical protein
LSLGVSRPTHAQALSPSAPAFLIGRGRRLLELGLSGFTRNLNRATTSFGRPWQTLWQPPGGFRVLACLASLNARCRDAVFRERRDGRVGSRVNKVGSWSGHCRVGPPSLAFLGSAQHRQCGHFRAHAAVRNPTLTSKPPQRIYVFQLDERAATWPIAAGWG